MYFSCKVPVIRDKFQQNFKFFDKISKNTRISNFLKILPGGSPIVPCRPTDTQDEASSHF